MKRPFQFRLRTLLIVVALFAFWTGVEMWADSGDWQASRGGALIDLGHDEPAYIASARGSLDAWLKSEGYSPTGDWPARIDHRQRPGEICYAANAKGPIHAYATVYSSNSLLSAEECVRTVVHGPFDHGTAAGAVLDQLFSSIRNWRDQYLAATPARYSRRK